MFSSSFFSKSFVRVRLVYLCSSTDTATPNKKSRFIWPKRSDFRMIDSLSITVHAFPMHILTSLSVDEMWLPRYVTRSTNFRDLWLKGEMAPYYSKFLNSILSAFLERPIRPDYAARTLLWSVYLWEALDYLRSLHFW